MKPIDVLFLCETNAAVSLMAEAIVNHRGDHRFRAFSAGRSPAPAMLAEARDALVARGIPVDALEPKAWSIFALPGARRPDLIVDLADVAGSTPGVAEVAGGAVLYWSLRDPAGIGRRAARRSTAEAVLRELADRVEGRLIDGLAALAHRPPADPRPVPAMIIPRSAPPAAPGRRSEAPPPGPAAR
jgi:arsenate reductase